MPKEIVLVTFNSDIKDITTQREIIQILNDTETRFDVNPEKEKKTPPPNILMNIAKDNWYIAALWRMDKECLEILWFEESPTKHRRFYEEALKRGETIHIVKFSTDVDNGYSMASYFSRLRASKRKAAGINDKNYIGISSVKKTENSIATIINELNNPSFKPFFKIYDNQKDSNNILINIATSDYYLTAVWEVQSQKIKILDYRLKGDSEISCYYEQTIELGENLDQEVCFSLDKNDYNISYFFEKIAPQSEKDFSSQKEEKKIFSFFQKILSNKKQIILQGPPGTGKTRMAKEIAKDILGLDKVEDLKNNPQFRLIQFHPAYTYEDFVRGIVAKTTEKGITYEVENKVLGNIVQKALQSNYEHHFNRFVDFLKNHKENITFKNNEAKYIDIENQCICVRATVNEKYEYNYPITELLKHSFHKYETKSWHHINGFKDAITEYFIDQFLPKDFQEKNFVLVIDEINRANLSAVLGELIYALEYRGESVESMYAIEGNHQLVLPENLYIIGTMNTADRSVGHLDYAIRRRFAFIDVLPEDLSGVLGKNFAQSLFLKVAELFENHLSSDFKKEQVQLGHSYFITEKTDIATRWKYEILPILLEYINDGVLIGENIEEIVKNLSNELDLS